MTCLSIAITQLNQSVSELYIYIIICFVTCYRHHRHHQNNTFFINVFGLMHSIVFILALKENKLVKRKEQLLLLHDQLDVQQLCYRRPMDDYDMLDWFKDLTFYKIVSHLDCVLTQFWQILFYFILLIFLLCCVCLFFVLWQILHSQHTQTQTL